MLTTQTPGIYKQDLFPVPPRELRTGVPAFLGLVEERDARAPSERVSLQASSLNGVSFLVRADEQSLEEAGIRSGEPERFTRWPQFQQTYEELRDRSYVGHAVRGFFENGGRLCYVQMVSFDQGARVDKALDEGLKTLAALDTIDLVCAPDILWPHRQGEPLPEDEVFRMQAAVLKHCQDLGDRFAILDPRFDTKVQDMKEVPAKLRGAGGLDGTSGALYYPWIKVLDGPAASDGYVPPCGHVAGVFAQTDERVGVHKAPANEALEGVVELKRNLKDADQDQLNPVGVNCLRAFPGRGIRVWGARTLSSERAWTYVNVRRLFLTVGRWIEHNMADVVFEPHDASLWARIRRELTVYLNELFRQGAFQGSTQEEAFYVKCDEELNPSEVREQGHVVVEIGLAPALPNEFVVVRIIHGVSGVTITGPMRPGQ
jgi:hypothetical protein